ncbi:hypothetical protein SKAU_G00036680 [Synaphobranchus kaupii]|uniref:Uncharacterized protein n=1 Tax=Synaphobranchus kaupii TaxID=118154 RepID=A0A9Q1JG12_SYNKA|nr:hypothetical protein SKAU_G00036680 [Synaphobranchus kaupii]
MNVWTAAGSDHPHAVSHRGCGAPAVAKVRSEKGQFLVPAWPDKSTLPQSKQVNAVSSFPCRVWTNLVAREEANMRGRTAASDGHASTITRLLL